MSACYTDGESVPMPVQLPARLRWVQLPPCLPWQDTPWGRARCAHGPAHRQGLVLDAAACDGAERQLHTPHRRSPPVPVGCSLLLAGPSGSRPGKDPCLEAVGAAGAQWQARGWRSAWLHLPARRSHRAACSRRDRGTGISRASFQSIDRCSSMHFFCRV